MSFIQFACNCGPDYIVIRLTSIYDMRGKTFFKISGFSLLFCGNSEFGHLNLGISGLNYIGIPVVIL